MKHLYYVILPLLVLFSSCHESRLNQALSASGRNRKELEKTLQYFKGDKRKYAAACFLIENMPGAYGTDTAILHACAPFYAQYDSLAHTFDYDSISRLYRYSRAPEYGAKLDSLWYNFYYRHYNTIQKDNMLTSDIKTIKSDRLIGEINLSFKAWEENIYTKGDSFNDFCEYILPYRRAEGLIIDSARQVFYKRHHGAFSVPRGKSITDAVDSLLYLYRDFGHSRYYAMRMPLLTATTFERLRHGLCEQRCWYNSLLLSSLGMEVAIDFVPEWGNRNNAHAWNVIIQHGQSYAFESFWDSDRWKYKRIYNNRTFDEWRGRFRAAKIYRYTYRQYIEGPIADKSVPLEDIPPLFKNVHKKDVSQEYFDTVNVRLHLSHIPSNTKYAYLCVYNYGQWKPVQWGKIETGENGYATFYGMGKDIVYLPMFCKEGTMKIAGPPFLLNANGNIQCFNPTGKTQDIFVYDYRGDVIYYDNLAYMECVRGIRLTGARRNGAFTDTLCSFPMNTELYSRIVNIHSSNPIRYIRMYLPLQKVDFNYLKFYQRGKVSPIKGAKFTPRLPCQRPKEKQYVDIDLGTTYLLSKVAFCPHLAIGFKKGTVYELSYWRNGWHSIGRVEAEEGKQIHFQNVPIGVLLIVMPIGGAIEARSIARPFIYKDNEIHWY
jgi:hypothetical protein